MRHIDQIAKLIGREPDYLGARGLGAAVKGKRVLVTGAGGSIGSELCRVIAGHKPKKLVMLNRSEGGLFELDRELDGKGVPVLCDICDGLRLWRVFEQHRPTVVFHAAAHKHVPLCEANPGEAVRNNVLGTKTLCDIADSFNVSRFVNICTDKAVNPSGVMGATKRAAEAYALSKGPAFCSVRFGNVLGSSGSVVDVWLKQLDRGEALTVTDPDMTRYFMTLGEAAWLCLRVAAMPPLTGAVYVLEMGEPVLMSRLVDAVREAAGKPEARIAYTGSRPGEKMHEELADGCDQTTTSHPKIRRWHVPEHADPRSMAADLYDCMTRSDEDVVAVLLGWLPEYRRVGVDG